MVSSDSHSIGNQMYIIIISQCPKKASIHLPRWIPLLTGFRLLNLPVICKYHSMQSSKASALSTCNFVNVLPYEWTRNVFVACNVCCLENTKPSQLPRWRCGEFGSMEIQNEIRCTQLKQELCNISWCGGDWRLVIRARCRWKNLDRYWLGVRFPSKVVWVIKTILSQLLCRPHYEFAQRQIEMENGKTWRVVARSRLNPSITVAG